MKAATRRAKARTPVVVAGRVLLEVGRDLEEPGELRVVLVQEVVEGPVSENDDLDVERDRLGLERAGRHEAQRLSRQLHADGPGAQCPLQGPPRERLREDVERVEEEIAAVRR